MERARADHRRRAGRPPHLPGRALRVHSPTGSGPYFNVGATVIADEEFRPRRCLWSHPFARGEIVTRFHHVPLGRGDPRSRRPLLDHRAQEGGRAHHPHRARRRRHRGDRRPPRRRRLGAVPVRSRRPRRRRRRRGGDRRLLPAATTSATSASRRTRDEPRTSGTRLRLADAGVALALAVGYVVWLLRTTGDLGYARDEGFYFQAAQSYGRWFEALLADRHAALERRAVDAAFALNHEHPALIKSLFALSSVFLQKRHHLFAMEGDSYRFPAMVLAGAVLALVYVWGTQARGRVAGLTAAVLLGGHAALLLPRAPGVLRRARRHHVDAGRLHVLALAARRRRALPPARGRLLRPRCSTPSTTRGSCPSPARSHFLALQAWALLARTRRGAAAPGAAGARRRRCKRGFVTLVAMALLGPPVLVALWPWLWHDTVPRAARVRALPPQPRVLQHGVPRQELLGCAHAEGIRVGDDGGDGADRDAGALRRGPRGARAGVAGRASAGWIRAAAASRAAPTALRRRGGHRSALAALHRRQLRRLALAADTHLRRHQALDDGVSLPRALRRGRLLRGRGRRPARALPPAPPEPDPAARRGGLVGAGAGARRGGGGGAHHRDGAVTPLGAERATRRSSAGRPAGPRWGSTAPSGATPPAP